MKKISKHINVTRERDKNIKYKIRTLILKNVFSFSKMYFFKDTINVSRNKTWKHLRKVVSLEIRL